MKNLRLSERKTSFQADYWHQHPTLSRNMRRIVVDWMVEVHWNWELCPVSIFRSVDYLDRFMALTSIEVSQERFQLVAITCLWIAAKVEDTDVPGIADCTYICDGAYKSDQIKEVEKIILNTLNYELYPPIAYNFIDNWLLEEELSLAYYILELALLEHGLVSTTPSEMASSAQQLALHISRQTPIPQEDKLAKHLQTLVKFAHDEEQTTSFQKYSKLLGRDLSQL